MTNTANVGNENNLGRQAPTPYCFAPYKRVNAAEPQLRKLAQLYKLAVSLGSPGCKHSP